MSINRVELVGNLTREIELRRTQSGTAVMSMGLAVNNRRRNGQTGEWEDEPCFVDLVMFGDRAEKISGYLDKGDKIAVDGRLRYSTWERDGQRRSKLEVVVDDIEFMSRKGSQGGAQGGYQQQTGGYAYGGGNAPQAAPQRPKGGYGHGQPAPQQQGGYQQQATQQQPVYAPTREEMPMQSGFESSIYDDEIPF